MKSRNRQTSWKRYLPLLPATLFVLGVVFLAGCSSEQTTAPEPREFFIDNPEVIRAPAAVRPMLSPKGDDDSDSWTLVAEGEVEDDESTVIQGGRYTLHFPKGAVDDEIDVTVHQYDGGILDIELGPHGVQFDRPVMLTVDYSGTNADPDSPNYDGSFPVFYWYVPERDAWLAMFGRDDPSAKTYTVKLSHFSRYLLGTGDWMRAAIGTGDW